MLKHRFVALFVLFLSCIDANPITPGPNITVISGFTNETPPVVSGTSAGYIVVSEAASSQFTSSFTSDGMTWSTPTAFTDYTFTGPWVVQTSAGAMATNIAILPGFSSATPISFFTTNQGNNWNGPDVIDNIDSAVNPVTVAGTGTSFMATWWNNNGNHPQSSTTTDGGMTWGTAQLISNGTENSAVMVAVAPSSYAAAWRQTDDNIYLALYNGTVWSTSSQLTMTGTVASDPWLTSFGSNMMIGWVDNSGNAQSIVSTDGGNTWSMPVQIASNVASTTDVSISAFVGGYIACWISASNNALASFSSDGSSWSTPVQINTAAGTVNTATENIGFGFACVSAFDSHCMFTWLDTSNNIISSYATIPSPNYSIQPPASIIGSQANNNFGLLSELFNTISWQPSPSSGVAGYNIYVNGAKTASVGPSTLSYVVHDQKKGAVTSYAVTAFDGSGNESTPVTVSVP